MVFARRCTALVKERRGGILIFSPQIFHYLIQDRAIWILGGFVLIAVENCTRSAAAAFAAAFATAAFTDAAAVGHHMKAQVHI